jgi:7,8-dihydropterin-6-yl-methyl-4-(beta-D-ribofuranosyl)aminobenzene 5'-phosphate synthase
MRAADGVKITILVENWIDILISEPEGVTRRGLIHHFDRKEQPLRAEGGLSLFVETWIGGRRSCVLFDSGLTPDVIAHNFGALGLDPHDVDHIAISHGHLDHHGGLAGTLELIGHPVPVLVHPDAFYPRYIIMGSGEVASFYNQALEPDELTRAGARLVLARDPVVIAPGIVSTGEIPLEVDFEGPPPAAKPTSYDPGIYQLREGEFVTDEVLDELGLAINVAGEGLVVITGCGHRGVINTVRRARQITGVEEVALVMGGFHLGFPGTPDEVVDRTVAALGELNARRIAPMHCSGFRCIAGVASSLPDAFLQYAVGSTFTVGAV